MMQAILQDHSRIKIEIRHISLARGLGWGLLGGLTATLVMDIILIGILVAAGLPALTCFSIVGDTAANLFSLGVVGTAGSIPMGIAAHYLIGPLMGSMFGAAAAKYIAVAKVKALRMDSLKKVIILAVLYAEILSQPMLAMASILLRMTASEVMQWFGGSLVMHMIWGGVLGAVWSRGLRLPIAAIPK